MEREESRGEVFFKETSSEWGVKTEQDGFSFGSNGHSRQDREVGI